MQQLYYESPDKKNHVKELFSSPRFYLLIFPHLVSIFLVLNANLGYFFIFSIFYLELIIDYLVLTFSMLFIKNQEVQTMYKSSQHKSVLVLRSLFWGIILLLFLGFLPAIVVFFIGMESVSVSSILNNSTIFLSVGTYFVTKFINFTINLSRYKNGQQKNIEDGKSFIINYLTIILLAIPGTHILLVFGIFIDNIQSVAAVLLFIFRAGIDSVFSFYNAFPGKDNSEMIDRI